MVRHGNRAPCWFSSSGAGAGGVEHPLPEPQHVAGDDRRRVAEERQHVDLAVPEVVAAVARTAHALGGDAAAVGAGGGLGELEEVPPGRLLQGRLAGDLDVGPLPVVVEPGALLGEELADAELGRPVEGAVAPVDELARRHLAGRVVASPSW